MEAKDHKWLTSNDREWIKKLFLRIVGIPEYSGDNAVADAIEQVLLAAATIGTIRALEACAEANCGYCSDRCKKLPLSFEKKVGEFVHKDGANHSGYSCEAQWEQRELTELYSKIIKLR